jgi:hypothetical protein
VTTLLESPEPPLRGEVCGPRDVLKPVGDDDIPEIEPHGSWVRRSEFQHSDTTPPDWSVVVVLEVWVEEARFVSLEY